MNVGFEPFQTPDAEDAAEQAKSFCKSRGLTPRDCKIVRRDGRVMVVITRDGAKIKV